MGLISRRTHGVLDYLTAGGLLALPRALGLSGPAAAFVRALGVGTAGYSALTDYELGVWRKLPFRAHLAIDAASALAFLAAPLVFRRERAGVRAALLGIGLFELGAALLSRPGAASPSAQRPTAFDTQPLPALRPRHAPPPVAGRAALDPSVADAGAAPRAMAPGRDPDAGALEAFGDDETTTDRVRSNLGRELQGDHLARLNINTQGGGVVFLRGQVRSEEQRARILAIVGSTEGVGDIVDELQIAREA